jgi:hypothetical protein
MIIKNIELACVNKDVGVTNEFFFFNAKKNSELQKCEKNLSGQPFP